MFNLTSELTEFTAESKFTWNIKNLSKINWGNNFIIKSEEFYFNEARARWWLKLSPFIFNGTKIFFISTFYLQPERVDINAKYRFSITMKDGSVIESCRICVSKTGELVENEMTKYIRVEDEDSLEITPSVSLLTLIHPQKAPCPPLPKPVKCEDTLKAAVASTKSVFEDLKEEDSPTTMRLPDIDELKEALRNFSNFQAEKMRQAKLLPPRNDDEFETLSETTISSDSSSDIFSSDSHKSIDSEIKNYQNVNPFSIAKMSEDELAELITSIYMKNMKLIAETTANLLVASACSDHKIHLNRSSLSLAGQLSEENYLVIWGIASKLKIECLKNAVIQFIVTNRERLHFKGQVPSDLMKELMKTFG